MSRLSLHLPDEFRKRTHNKGDSIHLILVRYLEAHPLAVSRDSEHRPVCPGPLYINNCLWRYARSLSPRGILRNRDNSPSLAYLTQTHVFGQTPAEQTRNYTRECSVYYSFIYPDHILSRSNVTELFIDIGPALIAFLFDVIL